jgi:hypothetical protein
MGLERAHAQLLSQGEGLAVESFGLLGLWGLALRRNVAKEAQGVSFLAPIPIGLSESQGALCLGVRLV